MSVDPRELAQSPIRMGKDESIAWLVDFTAWGTPDDATAALKLMNQDVPGIDVTATYMSGVTSVSGDVVTLPIIAGLEPGAVYRLEIKATIAGNVEECWALIYAEE
jgi:hypothetical protein